MEKRRGREKRKECVLYLEPIRLGAVEGGGRGKSAAPFLVS